jgi:hypothetical protein
LDLDVETDVNPGVGDPTIVERNIKDIISKQVISELKI